MTGTWLAQSANVLIELRKSNRVTQDQIQKMISVRKAGPISVLKIFASNGN